MLIWGDMTENAQHAYSAVNGVLAATPGEGHRASLLLGLFGGLGIAAILIWFFFMTKIGFLIIMYLGMGVFFVLRILVPLATVGGVAVFSASFIVGNGGLAVLGVIIAIAGAIAWLFMAPLFGKNLST